MGTCEYTPLFWALEAVYGEGHDEARQCVEWIVERRGWEVDEQQGLNHQSWTQGSLVACAVAAAVEAAAPIDELSIPPPPPAADPKAVDSGGPKRRERRAMGRRRRSRRCWRMDRSPRGD